ncbi:MAG: hypothetical protein N3F67_00165 [Acidilobaceae archaeon]|nr:hypothetical protein [Acidilobaceae archaeon]
MRPIEGWPLRVRAWGVEEIWIARGYRHPVGYIVSTPYRRGRERLKPYQLSNAPSWSLRWVDCIGREAPLVKEGEATAIDPERALRERRGDLWREVLELLDYLSPEWAGLTGSWAVFAEGPGSDVDLLLYGDFYSALKDLREEGLVAPCGRFEKVRDFLSWEDYLKLYRLKLLDACFRGRPYTIRALRTLEEEPCGRPVVYAGRYVGEVEIVEGREAHLTPARYRARLGGEEVELESWHTRYAELPEGRYFASLRLTLEGGVLKGSPDIDGFLRPLRHEAGGRA